MMRVGVIILNWNNGRATTVCIQDVLRLRYPFAVAYVVDNGSSDGSLEAIRAFLQRTGRPIVQSSFDSRSRTLTEGRTSAANGVPVHLIAIDSNLGYGGGNNVGIALALQHGADAVWVLNNDARPEPDSLDALVAIAGEDARHGMVGSLVLADDGTDRVQCVGGSRYDWLASRSRAIGQGSSLESAQTAIHRLPDYIDGCAIFLTRPFILDVGAFEEAYHLYCEEIDLAARARSRGWGWAVARSSIVRHGFGATSGSSRDRRRRSPSSYYYASRSAVMLVRKLRPRLVPFVAAARFAFAASLAVHGLWTPARAVLRGASNGLTARPVGDPSFRAVTTLNRADSE
jgi:GT2 family glycosyltransferase